jgi:glycosidase
MNLRQITPSGTFDAARAELPRLKNMGVDVVWVMPLQPIGIKGRKGTLGSYYAIKDYTDFNPEFGNRSDFQRFVDDAHRLGIKVLLDWVANHTSPDHAWIAHQSWHKRNPDGSLAMRSDWTDVAELNYGSSEMRSAMIDAMKFWLAEMRIDGFRCDMAMLVPTDFWEQAAAALKQINPDLLMLAEAESPDLMRNAFNIYYAWELHHAMNEVAQGKASAQSLWTCIDKQCSDFPASAVPMLFTSNHDENSWNGTEFERMGERGAEAFAALCYVVRGIPLIYTGQEFGNRHRLAFFEKDNIKRLPNAPQMAMYTALNALRRATPALWSSAEMHKINNSQQEHVFSILRRQGDRDGSEVVAIFNLCSSPVDLRFDGNGGNDQNNQNIEWRKYALHSGGGFTFNGDGTLHLEAWEYQIGVRG